MRKERRCCCVLVLVLALVLVLVWLDLMARGNGFGDGGAIYGLCDFGWISTSRDTPPRLFSIGGHFGVFAACKRHINHFLFFLY